MSGELAVSATVVGPARSATVSATFPVVNVSAVDAPSRPRTFDSSHERGRHLLSRDKRAG
jgi:hypothetical protein